MKNNSQDFYNERLRDLANFGTNLSKKSESTQSTLIGECVKSLDGTSYGIIKENHKYIIKKSTSQKENLCESDFSYIGGVQNKTDYSYPSLADAEKNRNMFVLTLNEAYNSAPIISEVPKQTISESVEEKIENPLGFLTNVINGRKKDINEGWSNKFKDTVKKHSIQGKQQIIGENVVDNLRKTMNLLTEGAEDNVDSDIDKAIDALDNLENKTSQEGEATPEQTDIPSEVPQETTVDTETETNVETPTPDGGEDLTTDNTSDVETSTAEPTPDEAPAETPSAEPTEDNTADAELTKEIEKLVGKLTYNVRKAELSPDETNSFLKSIISSFEGELSGLDPNQKKELTKKIMSDQESTNDADVEVQTEGFEEDGSEQIEDNDEMTCDECNTFDVYSKSLGYDSLDGVSPIEKGYVISGYIDGYKNGKNDGDFGAISKHLSPEVVNELAEYGHDDYTKEAEFYMNNLEDLGNQENGEEMECEGCNQVSEAEGGLKDFNSLSDDEKTEAFQMYLQKKAGIAENKADFGFAKTETIGVVKPNSVNESRETFQEYVQRIGGYDKLPKPKYNVGDVVLVDMGDGTTEKLTISKVSYFKPPMGDFTYSYKTKEYEKTEPNMVTLENDILKPSSVNESVDKPADSLSKEKKSEVVKAGKKGQDIGKKSKGFEKVSEKAAKEYDGKEMGEKEGEEINEGKLKEFIKNVLKECVTGKKSVINESAIKQFPNLQKIESYVRSEYAKRTNK